MFRLRGPTAMGLLLLALSTAPARAATWPVPADVPLAGLGPRSPEAEQAERLLAEGEFEKAVVVLERGVAAPDVSDDALVELYRLMGLAQLYLGNTARARDAYEKLLQARPDYEIPPSAPPKIRELYARIKEDVRKRRVRPVTLTAETPTEVTAGQPLVTRAHIEDLALGAKPKLYYRRAGAQSYSSVDYVREPGSREAFTATVPAFELPEEPRPYDIEFYVEVADAAQRRLAGRGDAFNPHHFTVLPAGTSSGAVSPSPAWYRSPWVWVAGGVIAAGATAGIIAVASQQPTGTLPITIRVNP